MKTSSLLFIILIVIIACIGYSYYKKTSIKEGLVSSTDGGSAVGAQGVSDADAYDLLLSTYYDVKATFKQKHYPSPPRPGYNAYGGAQQNNYFTSEELRTFDGGYKYQNPVDGTDGRRWKSASNFVKYQFSRAPQGDPNKEGWPGMGAGWAVLPTADYPMPWKYDWFDKEGVWEDKTVNGKKLAGPAYGQGSGYTKENGLWKTHVYKPDNAPFTLNGGEKDFRTTLSFFEFVANMYKVMRDASFGPGKDWSTDFEKAVGEGQTDIVTRLKNLYPRGSGLCYCINYFRYAMDTTSSAGWKKRAQYLGWTPMMYAAAASNIMAYHDWQCIKFDTSSLAKVHMSSNMPSLLVALVEKGAGAKGMGSGEDGQLVYKKKSNLVNDVNTGYHGENGKAADSSKSTTKYSLYKLIRDMNQEISDAKKAKLTYYEGVSKRRKLNEEEYKELNTNIKNFGISGEGSNEEGMFNTFKSFVDKAFKNTFFLPITNNAETLEKCQDPGTAPNKKGKGRIYNEDISTSSYYFPGCGENKCCGVATNYDVLNEVSSDKKSVEMYRPAPWMIKGKYTNAKPDNNNYNNAPINKCPVGTKKIETSAECLMAAKYLGYNLKKETPGASTTPGLWLSNNFDNTIPSGCTITTAKSVKDRNEDGHLAHWQPIDGGDGDASGGLIPLCKVDNSSCEIDRLSGVVFSRDNYTDKEFPGCGESSCCLHVGTFTKNNKDYTVKTNKTKPNFCYPMEKGDNDDTGKIYGIDEIVKKINAKPPLNNELLKNVTEADVIGKDPNVRNEMIKYGMHFSFNIGELLGNQCKSDGTENSACSLSYKLYEPSEGDYKCDLSLCVQDTKRDGNSDGCYFGKGSKTKCDNDAKIKKLEYDASKSGKKVCTTSAPTLDDNNTLVDNLKNKLADLTQNQKDYEKKLKDAEDALKAANTKLEENPDDADAIAAAAAAAEAKRIADEQAKRLADEKAKTAKEKENAEKNRLDQIINDISKHSKQQDERWKRWDEHAASSLCNTGNCGPSSSNQLDELKKQLDDLKKEETCALEGFGNRIYNRNVVEGFVGFSSFGRSTIVEGNTNKVSTQTAAPTTAPTATPTDAPTTSPTAMPTASPTVSPSSAPTSAPIAETTTTDKKVKQNEKKFNNPKRKQIFTTQAPPDSDMTEQGPLEQAGSTFGRAADQLFADEKFFKSMNIHADKEREGSVSEQEKHNMGKNNRPGSSQYNGSGVTVICENSNGGEPSYSRQSTDVNDIFTNSGLIGNGGSESGPASVPNTAKTLPPTPAPKTKGGSADTILDTFANMGRNTRFFMG